MFFSKNIKQLSYRILDKCHDKPHTLHTPEWIKIWSKYNLTLLDKCDNNILELMVTILFDFFFNVS